MLGDDLAQGPWKSRRIKNVDGYLFSAAMLMLRGRPTKQGVAFPEQTAMNGVGYGQTTENKR